MKQYGTAMTVYANCGVRSGAFSQMNFEAIVGSSYGKLARNSRRRENKSAVTWWRSQIEKNGMPNQRHCGGYGK